jgi:membrane-bound lytic murein transglycosylase D
MNLFKSVILLSFLGLTVSACSSLKKNSDTEENSASNTSEPVEEDNYEEEIFVLEGADELNLKNKEFTFPVEYNRRVKKWIKYFTSRKGRRIFQLYEERSGKFRDHILKTLRKYQIPSDLLYLAMIESGFSQTARSHAAAVGPWQFIKSTGKLYDLKIGWWIDERQDPIKSTEAAARHLKDLYVMFKDWHLAAAAYNAGPRKISRAIRRYKSRSFWKLAKYRYIRRETKNYVPKIIAAAIISKNLETFGFEDVQYHEPLNFEEYNVDKVVDLYDISEKLDISFQDLKHMNPELLRWTTPTDVENYPLRLPKGTSKQFSEIYASLSSNLEELPFARTVPRRNTSVRSISRSFKIPRDVIAQLNGISKTSRIKKGKEIIIPIKEGHTGKEKLYWYDGNRRRYRSLAARKRWKKKQKFVKIDTKNGKFKIIRYVMKKGDNLWDISRSYGVSVTKLKRWNGLSGRAYKFLRPGDHLRIRIKSS